MHVRNKAEEYSEFRETWGTNCSAKGNLVDKKSYSQQLTKVMTKLDFVVSSIKQHIYSGENLTDKSLIVEARFSNI